MKGTQAVSSYVHFETCHTIMVCDVQVLDTFFNAFQYFSVILFKYV
jgi:hypothetical protein